MNHFIAINLYILDNKSMKESVSIEYQKILLQHGRENIMYNWQKENKSNVTKYRYRAPAAERYGHKKNKNFTSYGSGADDTDRDHFENKLTWSPTKHLLIILNYQLYGLDVPVSIQM